MNGFSSRIHKQHLEHFLYMYKNFRQHLNEWVLVYISRSGCQRCYWEYEKQADTPDSCTGLEAANTLQGREQIEVGLEDLWKPENFHCPALSSLVCVCVCVCVCVHSVISNFLQLHRPLRSTRLLCPWNFPGWTGFPFPSPRDLPDLIKPTSLISPVLTGWFFTSWPTRETHDHPAKQAGQLLQTSREETEA